MGLDKFSHKFRTEIFDAKASNKARVWGEWGRDGLTGWQKS